MTPTRTTTGQEPSQVRDAAISMARKWARRPAFRVVAMRFLLPWAPPSASKGEGGDWTLDAAQAYGVERWRFMREPAGADHAGEVVLSPCISIQLNAGDCDDFAALIASVMKTFGVRCRIGWLPTGPNSAHILAACQRGWYANPSDPYWVVDPQIENPVNAERIGAHWADV